MNISENEQRALHVLALGSQMLKGRDEGPKITPATCTGRDAMILCDLSVAGFGELRGQRLIEAQWSGPHDISKRGCLSVPAQRDKEGA